MASTITLMPARMSRSSADQGCLDLEAELDAHGWSSFDHRTWRYHWPPLNYLCTLVLSRKTWPELPSFSLPWVADAAGSPLADHHEPLSDARAAAAVLVAAAQRYSAESLTELADKAHVFLGFMGGFEWKGSMARTANQMIPAANDDADPNHPFYGREVVFTGALLSMTRAVAHEWVAALGAQPAGNVTKRTNVLVTGYQDPGVLTHGLALSRKAQKAADLRARGQEIETVPEDDFIRMLRL